MSFVERCREYRTCVDRVSGEAYARVAEVSMPQPHARIGATVEDLYKVEGKAEIVGGELVLMSPGGFGHGRVAANIVRSLAAYEETSGAGYAIPDNVGFVVDLPARRSFSPDARSPGRGFQSTLPVELRLVVPDAILLA